MQIKKQNEAYTQWNALNLNLEYWLKHFFILTLFGCLHSALNAQNGNDTGKTKQLRPVFVKESRVPSDIDRLEPIKGTYIHAGKKTEVIELTHKNVAITEKYGRQIFAKIPGIFVYDMDGTGNQVNISTRGLDPHRGWEFNIRKDGILTNSDMYGYPASHYNIPMEAVERIELVRGTGSLQYGAQFGGMLNYISKQPDTLKKLSFENINTVGSYGLISIYNSISGKIGKLRYSAWINRKTLSGYRANSSSEFEAEAISLFYDIHKNIHIKIEWTHSNYITQLPGPLTDSMFQLNPRMSTRARNYYNPNIHIPSISIDYNLTQKTKLRLTSSAVLGTRNSVMFDKPATVADTIVTTNLGYNYRQVDIDNFNSYTSEIRMLHTYSWLNQSHTLTSGIQFMNNNMRRRQQGIGTAGTDFDLSISPSFWGRDLYYRTQNMAIFAENNWSLSHKFSIQMGARIEKGETRMDGSISYYSDSALPNEIHHKFPMLGISTQYTVNDEMNVYGGFSQAYRPVIFKDIIPASVYEESDKNLKDAFGYNAEIGFRGKWRIVKWDISGFYLQYNNRLGTLANTRQNGDLVIFRTNIGNSRTTGIELFFQSDFQVTKNTSVSAFTSTSFMDARYRNATIKSGSNNINIDNNKVESVPTYISRNGLTVKYSFLSVSALYSYTSESFADAVNSITPSKNGATGIVPAYHLFDANIAIQLNDKIKIQLNTNNIFNRQYFTKRPQFYPGPGIWPSDGRSFSGTFIIKL